MQHDDGLTERFDDSRAHLRAVAHRMLGTDSEADDAVQETWLKLSRADTSDVANLRGWLTTVIARVCLDMLRSRRARREEPAAVAEDAPGGGDPETDVASADAIGPAMQVVLDTLSPPERVAFVLHDMFELAFEDIAPIIDKTPAATRQLASRARRRVRGATAPATEVAEHRELVSAFLAASRDGDLARLVAVLSPGVVLRADALAVTTAKQRPGAPVLDPELRGAAQVADAFRGRARAALPALIDGAPGAVWRSGGRVRTAFLFTIEGDRITAIELVMEPDHLAVLDVAIDER